MNFLPREVLDLKKFKNRRLSFSNRVFTTNRIAASLQNDFRLSEVDLLAIHCWFISVFLLGEDRYCISLGRILECIEPDICSHFHCQNNLFFPFSKFYSRTMLTLFREAGLDIIHRSFPSIIMFLWCLVSLCQERCDHLKYSFAS